MVHTTVIKSVPILRAPIPVPVTVDIHSRVIGDHALVMSNNKGHTETCVLQMLVYIQILMSVQMVHLTVIKCVPTLRAPSHVPVTVDIHC